MQDVLQKLRVSEAQTQEIEEILNSLADKLSDYGLIKLNGSYATGTLIKKTRGDIEDFVDVDLLVVFNNHENLTQAKNILEQILKNKTKVVEKGSKVITLEYATGFQIDILPVKETEENNVYELIDGSLTMPSGVISQMWLNECSPLEKTDFKYKENTTLLGQYAILVKKIKKKFEHEESIDYESRFSTIALTIFSILAFEKQGSFKEFVANLINIVEEERKNKFSGVVNLCYEKEEFYKKLQDQNRLQSLDRFLNVLKSIEEVPEHDTNDLVKSYLGIPVNKTKTHSHSTSGRSAVTCKI